MEAKTPAEVEALKQEMYERLSPRQKKYVDRIGYDNWEPFQLPNDPLDIRRNKTGHTAQELALLFFRDHGGKINENYKASVTEFTIQLLAQPERCRPLYDFCLWYDALLKRQGQTF
jgi:hypothetical protein